MKLLKNLLLLCFISGSFVNLSAQKKMKDYSLIMRSTNIYEIDAYLKNAHPDDPKRQILKPRLVKLLKEYIKNAHPADQRVVDFQEKLALLRSKPSTKISFEEMGEIIKQKQIAKYKEELEAKTQTTARTTPGAQNAETLANTVKTAASALLDTDEQEEFLMLMSVSPIEHKNKTVQILNSLFDNDPNGKESIVMIENKSDCNMIMRIEGVGNTRYRLAIPSQAESAIVVQKGSYLFSSKVCGAEYASQKTLEKAIMVSLNNPGH